MPEVTICVLTYGDNAHLAGRAIDSIRNHCPRSEYELVVGANAVSDAARAGLEGLKASGVVDHLLDSPVNLSKCPMMRRMFGKVNSKFIWWFDDDSFITSPDAWSRWLRPARAAADSTVMWGQVYRCNSPADFTDLENAIPFVRAASWYQGLPPPSWHPGGKGEFNFDNRNCGDGRWDFVVGGCWLIRASTVRALDWPDPRLGRLGDDVFLGEAIRQHGWNMANLADPGVAINTAPRRGPLGRTLLHLDGEPDAPGAQRD